VAFLERHYGLAIDQLTPGPRGWTGITHTVALRDGSRVFVKLFPRRRLPSMTLAALPVLATLDLPEAPRPLASRSGALHEWLGDDLVVVFEYVNGPRVDPRTLRQECIGDLIARLHQQPPRPLERETFRWPHARRWPYALARAQQPSADPTREGLRRFLRQQQAAHANAWSTFKALGGACRVARFHMVLTHGDWPFNLLYAADGTIHLVDWDELLLAPPERDTWFATDDADFLRGYRAVRADYAPGELATAYYLHLRYFEDLLGLLRAIVDGDDPRHIRPTAVESLTGPWMTGLRQRMAGFARQS